MPENKEQPGNNKIMAAIGFVFVVFCICCIVLAAIGFISLWTRAENKAQYEEMKATLESRNETINRAELKLEFLERHCRWLIFINDTLPPDIAAELDALGEQLKQRKEEFARKKYGDPKR